MISRRTFIVRGTGLVLAGSSSQWLNAQLPTFAAGSTPITVYKSSTCLCCSKWVDHLRASGFAATVHDEEEMDRIKDELGVPKAMRSCHTAVADKYLIEGHVPASDIRRLLVERPKIAGLAAPGMPAQSPGMAEPGAKPQGYDVLAFQTDGSARTFARY
jgi:hypothetical protein